MATKTFTDLTFTNYTGAIAVEIQNAGTYTFHDCFWDKSGTYEIECTNASGNVQIILTGTTTDLIDITDVNQNGAGTHSVERQNTLTITGVPSGVQVTIVNSSTRAELQNSTSTGADITYVHGGGETVDILFMANSYDPNAADVYDLTLPNTDSSIPISLPDDPNYLNP